MGGLPFSDLCGTAGSGTAGAPGVQAALLCIVRQRLLSSWPTGTLLEHTASLPMSHTLGFKEVV